MRIIVNGKQEFGRVVLEALLDRGEDVVGVYTVPEPDGRAADPVKVAALERGIPVFQPKSFRPASVREQMRALAPDLGVMAYVTAFVPESVLNVPTRGTIQYHPSLLPMHKGPSAINWPIVRGENKTGLSIFWPDKNLDTGPLLLQKEVAIKPDDTVGSIYFNQLFPMGVDAMLEAVALVAAGKAPRIPQDPSAGSYEGWFREPDAEVHWTRPARDIYNLIRGANPQPGAWTWHGGEKLQLFDCRLHTSTATDPGRPDPGWCPAGQIKAVSARGFLVAAPGGDIEVLRVRAGGGAKISAAEFAAASLKVGDRFQTASAELGKAAG